MNGNHDIAYGRGEGARQLRAGIFLVGSLLLLVGSVFLIGRSQALFVHRAHLNTAFENTSGLVVGAPVRLAGVDIGVVDGIRFDRDLHKKTVHVTLAVDRRYLDRIRQDSVARLSSKGLLGDVLINITVGSAEAPALADGATLRAQESEGLTEIVSSLKDSLGEVRALAGTVQHRLDAVLTDQLGRDLGRIAGAAANVVEQVERGDGLAHTLLYDRQLSRQASGLVGDARRAALTANGAVERLDRILAQVQSGGGTAHDLIYGDGGSRLLAELQRTARELTAVTSEIRTGKGMLHTLVYEQDRKNLVENLTEVSRILRDIGEEVQQGKGTVGALLKDPSVYEDLKTILGNVKRNRLLRSLVRYTIKKDGLQAAP